MASQDPKGSNSVTWKGSTKDDKSLLKTILGGIALLTFVAVWVTSLSSPFIFYLSIRFQKYGLTAAIVFLTCVAYAPWKRGILTKHFTAFVQMNIFYYAKFTKIFVGGSEPEAYPKPKLYGVHPHGAFCMGWAALFCSDVMHTVRFVFAPALYASPFFRIFSRAVGRPGSAGKADLIMYMKKGENIAIPPGGFEEATLSSTKHDRVYIKKRVGFIKLALIHGYDVVPVYVFGENRTYFNVQGNWKMRLKMNSFNLPGIVVWGLSFMPLMPKRDKDGLYIVAGAPLKLPKIENPTREEVKLWHDKYIAALVKVYEDHKCDAYGQEVGQVSKMELW